MGPGTMNQVKSPPPASRCKDTLQFGQDVPSPLRMDGPPRNWEIWEMIQGNNTGKPQPV